MKRWLTVAVVSLVACGGSERTGQVMVQQVPVPNFNETLHAEGAQQFLELRASLIVQTQTGTICQIIAIDRS